MKFCPECGTKVERVGKFCPECGTKLAGPDGAEEAQGSVIHRASVETGGAVEDSVISRSTVKTDRAAIKDAVISHSTITQVEQHQHFGESVGTYDAQMDLGRTAFEGKNWPEAVEFFNAALRIDAKNLEPWFLKGLSCAELGRTEEAVTNLRRALKLGEAERPRLLGEIRKVAEAVYKKGLVLETQANELLGRSNLEMQYSYGYRNSAQTQRQGAGAKALALDLLVMPGLGTSLRTSTAVEGLEKKQEADKREAEAVKLRDQASELLSGAVKHYNSSVRFCDLVLEHGKGDEYSLMKRGEIFLRLKLYQDACQSYEELLSVNPYHREALRLRGTCYAARGLRIPPPPPVAGPEKKPAAQAGPGGQGTAPPAPGAPAQAAPRSRGPAAAPPRPVQPPEPGPPGQAPQKPAAVQRPPPQAQARGPPANPCPYCRSDMAWAKEKDCWYCPACRRFSARPLR